MADEKKRRTHPDQPEHAGYPDLPEHEDHDFEKWPAHNPFGIARLKQSTASFRRGETAVGGSAKAASVGVTFSNPTPQTLPQVGDSSIQQLVPPDDVGDTSLRDASEGDPAAVADPFGAVEWSGWMRPVKGPDPEQPADFDDGRRPIAGPAPLPPDPSGSPAPPLRGLLRLEPDAVVGDPSVTAPSASAVSQPSLEAEAAAPATAWGISAVDLYKSEGAPEPRVRLEAEVSEDTSEVAGHRGRSRSEAQEAAAEAAAEAPPPKPEPRNYSQFAAVIVLLLVLNVPAILVLHQYLSKGEEDATTEAAEGRRVLSPEDLATIADEMFTRTGDEERVLDEWRLSREEYSRLMSEVNTDPALRARYDAARRTGAD